jgi:hypothetical protein
MDQAELRALLERTPACLDALLRGLPSTWVLANEGPGTWNPFDVVGHLIHGEESDWIPRARIVLEHGEARPFEPFDRFAQERDARGKTLPQLLTRFAEARAASLRALDDMQLTPADLARTGTHPDFGRVTLGELLATWAVHDAAHIAQIARVLAKHAGPAVGPWRKYLPILER